MSSILKTCFMFLALSPMVWNIIAYYFEIYPLGTVHPESDTLYGYLIATFLFHTVPVLLALLILNKAKIVVATYIALVIFAWVTVWMMALTGEMALLAMAALNWVVSCTILVLAILFFLVKLLKAKYT